MRESNDNGATWSVPRLIDPNDGPEERPSDHHLVYSAGADLWVATYSVTGGAYRVSDRHLAYSYSSDGAQTWSFPAAVNANAGGEFGGGLATDGNGSWAALVLKPGSLQGDVAIATSLPECDTTPRTDCKAASPGKSKLDILNRKSFDDRLQWRWKGEETSALDFGNPAGSEPLALCLYDTSPAATNVFEKNVPVAPPCGGQPCWISGATKLEYRDREQLRTSTYRIKIKPGPDGKASIAFASSGASLGPPTLPFAHAPAVTAQLVNLASGACWSATYSAALKNETGTYKARSD